ncbi:hypothetical protein E2C01_080756 [Portunus trituberculatus]|uniref:Uncharacterized protein n=1 Tax=Portunus trituberculatus TaxID=210409 RepID=A0A5B7IKG6_PORTR|nr:hypothetical protein [Portunus trituberculatus]
MTRQAVAAPGCVITKAGTVVVHKKTAINNFHSRPKGKRYRSPQKSFPRSASLGRKVRRVRERTCSSFSLSPGEHKSTCRKAWHGKARQVKARQGKARQGKARARRGGLISVIASAATFRLLNNLSQD